MQDGGRQKWYMRTSGSKGYRCEPSLIPFLKAELLSSQMKNVKFDQFFIFSCLLRRHLTFVTCLEVAIGRRSQFCLSIELLYDGATE